MRVKSPRLNDQEERGYGPYTLRLHVAVWYIHRHQSENIVTLSNPFKAHVCTIKLHGALGIPHARAVS